MELYSLELEALGGQELTTFEAEVGQRQTYRIAVSEGGISIPMPPAVTGNTTEQEFYRLANKWISETAMISDPVRRFMDRSHLKIIAMGEKVLPLVLKEVEKMSGPWFVALDAISPVNPVRPEDQLSLESTARAWVEWGKREGLI